MTSKKIQIIGIMGALVLSVFLGYFSQDINKIGKVAAYSQIEREPSVVEQEVISTLSSPMNIKKIYDKDQLIGIITDEKRLTNLLEDVYNKEYKEAFPDTQLGYVDDIYISEELTYNQYEDKDQEIFEYVYKKELIAIEVPKIEFSNGHTIFVKNVSDFNNARETFIKSYINEEIYDLLRNNKKVPRLKSYGEQIIDFKVNESIVVSKGYASIENIYLDEVEILNYLSFGKEPEYKNYTVQEYDTVQGIAVLNKLSVNQLLSINKEKLKDDNQILIPGTELNVTEFNSPFNVIVTKERRVEEVIHPDEPIIQKDPSLKEGLTRIEVKEEKGLKDTVYEDVYVNDEPLESNVVSSKVVKEPVREVVKVGTYVEPRIGSGSFAWPMSNARMICGWYCYPGHQAVDIQSRSNRGYGPIYASDRGYIASAGFESSRGYYVIINHNNGFSTYYYHMDGPAYLPAGSTVRRGEQIGYVGMTGRTTAPHVHFEIRYNGVRQNPCNYIGC